MNSDFNQQCNACGSAVATYDGVYISNGDNSRFLCSKNIKLLIRQKDELYPDVNIQIVNAIIHEIDGQNHITVASAKME